MAKILFLLCFISAISVSAQNLKVVEFDELHKEISSKSDTIKVINFWATWCKPCIIELPHFNEASEKISGKYKFIYVSLDFESKLSKVKEMIKEKNLNGEYYLLVGDPNEWINKIDPDWQGDIPYTAVVQNGDIVKKAARSFDSADELLLFINK